MYNTQILNKYNFVFTNYDTNEAITKQSVPNEYRLINTILSYLDFKGFLHIELFVGTEEDITDDKWIDETNWVSTKLIYHKCFNEGWDTDFATTAIKVPCPVRYRGNVLHIQDVPAYDTCGEVYYEDKTYRYKCICCDDYKYGNIDNWEEYDFQLVIDDIVKIVTDLMEQANDISYGLTTPDEDMIKDLIQDIINQWLDDDKLQQIINEWLNQRDLDEIINNWLEEADLSQQIQEAVNNAMKDIDISDQITNAVNQWLEENDLTDVINNAVTNYLGDNLEEILNNYFGPEGPGYGNLEDMVDQMLDDKIGQYLEDIKAMLKDNERVIANALSRHEEDIIQLKQ